MSPPPIMLASRFATAHPEDAAQVLESFSIEEIIALLTELAPDSATRIVGHLMRSTAAQCLTHLPARVSGSLMAGLPEDTAAAVLRLLDAGRRDALLADLPRDTARRLARLATFPDGTAGALMTPRVYTAPASTTIGEVLERFRTDTSEVRYYVYVVDAAHHPVGVVTVRRLLQGPESSPVSTVMERNVICLAASDTVETIRAHPKWSDVHALPVVDDQGSLVGVLRYETYRRLLRQAQGSPVGATVDALASFGELWWQTVAELVDDIALTVSGEAGSRHPPTESHGRLG